MRRRISEDIFVLYPNRDVRYHIIYCTWNCWHCNLQPDPTQFLMYVSLVHPLARKKCFSSYGQLVILVQPAAHFPFPSGEHRWKRCTFGTEKNAREEKSSQCASHLFFVGDFWCCRVLLILYKRPTNGHVPMGPKKSVWISWWFSFPRWVRCLDVMISFLRCHDLQRFVFSV